MAVAPGPTIETRRLILRPTASQDLEPWVEFMAHESTRFIGGPQPRSAVLRGFVTMAGAWAMDGFAMFSVIEKASGRWIGRVGPWRPEGWPGTEVGWGISADVQGKGYATEAAAASMDWAFANLGWSRIIHTIDPLNTPSQVVAMKLGSKNLGVTKLPPPLEAFNVEAWGQTREEWAENRRALICG